MQVAIPILKWPLLLCIWNPQRMKNNSIKKLKILTSRQKRPSWGKPPWLTICIKPASLEYLSKFCSFYIIHRGWCWIVYIAFILVLFFIKGQRPYLGSGNVFFIIEILGFTPGVKFPVTSKLRCWIGWIPRSSQIEKTFQMNIFESNWTMILQRWWYQESIFC